MIILVQEYRCFGTTVSYRWISGFRSSGTAVLPHKNNQVIYQSWRGLPFGDISAVLFCFLSVGMFYKLDGDKTKLVLGILTGIACLADLGWYVWKTL